MSLGWVYIIAASCGDEHRVKIGYTKGDPMDRLRSLQCGSPIKLGIYTAFEAGQKFERVLHETFAPVRIHGEWFEVKGKLLTFLACLTEGALTRRPIDTSDVLFAIEAAVLSDDPPAFIADPENYAASASDRHWGALRKVCEQIDAEAAEVE